MSHDLVRAYFVKTWATGESVFDRRREGRSNPPLPMRQDKERGPSTREGKAQTAIAPRCRTMVHVPARWRLPTGSAP